MICRVPLEFCPACSYLLRGLPIPGRCPECGFKFDADTLVAKPPPTWTPSLRRLVLATFIVIMLEGPIAAVLLVTIGQHLAPVVTNIILSTILIISLINAIAVYRQVRFAATGPDGMVVRNHRSDTTIPYADIQTAALQDSPPWIKRKGVVNVISLEAIFSNNEEAATFQRAISLRKSGQPFADVFDSAPGPTPQQGMAEPVGSTDKGDRLKQVGLILIIIGFVGSWIGSALHATNSVELKVLSLAPVPLGIAAYFVGAHVAAFRPTGHARSKVRPTPTNPSPPHSSDPPP